MSTLNNEGVSTAIFAKPLASTGKFHINSEEGEEGAKLREIENKETGEVKTVWEKHYAKVTGKITSLEIKDGNYGTALYVGVNDEVVIATGTSSPFGTDMMKAIPNLNIEEEVTFSPYAFTSDDGKKLRGMSIKQGGEKIKSFFSKDLGNSKYENTNGMPNADETAKPERTNKVKWSKFWTNYFDEVDEFLVAYIQDKHTIEYVEKEETTMEEDLEAISNDTKGF